MDLGFDNYKEKNISYGDYILNFEEILQQRLNDSNLQIDKEGKKIAYKGNLYSVNNNGQLTKDEKGIILNKNKLNFQIIGDNKTEQRLTAKRININSELIWTTSNEKVAKVENGNIIPVSEGEAIITVTCRDEIEYTTRCNVKVESFLDDSYVQYDVEYNDIYSNKRFTRNTGWQLITQEQNEDGTYNIEFISTGIPCELCYGWYEIGRAIWKPSKDIKNEYMSKFYDSTSNTNASYAASGLYYNFDKIVFKKQISVFNEYNIGNYVNISYKKDKIMEQANGDITGDIFIVKKGAKVRNVTLSDVRGYDKIENKEAKGVKSYNSDDEYADKKIGLFKLNDYYLDNKNAKRYFFANPSSAKSSYHILALKSNGEIYTSNGGRLEGLRPVISMKNVNMEKDGCVWIIKD